MALQNIGAESMDNNIKNYFDSLMVSIPGGIKHLRDYRDKHKWISSDSQMSIPGLKGNLIEIERKVDITTFFLAKYPVTKSMYELITQKALNNVELSSIPMVKCILVRCYFILQSAFKGMWIKRVLHF